ncbi:unnamed protein product [Amoebophrya sp. A120]|nr:unnamed protein product [Amoebophrya sp. A120]|eukprot:GSA120T00022616001.1
MVATRRRMHLRCCSVEKMLMRMEMLSSKNSETVSLPMSPRWIMLLPLQEHQPVPSTTFPSGRWFSSVLTEVQKILQNNDITTKNWAEPNTTHPSADNQSGQRVKFLIDPETETWPEHGITANWDEKDAEKNAIPEGQNIGDIIEENNGFVFGLVDADFRHLVRQFCTSFWGEQAILAVHSAAVELALREFRTVGEVNEMVLDNEKQKTKMKYFSLISLHPLKAEDDGIAGLKNPMPLKPTDMIRPRSWVIDPSLPKEVYKEQAFNGTEFSFQSFSLTEQSLTTGFAAIHIGPVQALRLTGKIGIRRVDPEKHIRYGKANMDALEQCVNNNARAPALNIAGGGEEQPGGRLVLQNFGQSEREFGQQRVIVAEDIVLDGEVKNLEKTISPFGEVERTTFSQPRSQLDFQTQQQTALKNFIKSSYNWTGPCRTSYSDGENGAFTCSLFFEPNGKLQELGIPYEIYVEEFDETELADLEKNRYSNSQDFDKRIETGIRIEVGFSADDSKTEAEKNFETKTHALGYPTDANKRGWGHPDLFPQKGRKGGNCGAGCAIM